MVLPFFVPWIGVWTRTLYTFYILHHYGSSLESELLPRDDGKFFSLPLVLSSDAVAAALFECGIRGWEGHDWGGAQRLHIGGAAHAPFQRVCGG